MSPDVARHASLRGEQTGCAHLLAVVIYDRILGRGRGQPDAHFDAGRECAAWLVSVRKVRIECTVYTRPLHDARFNFLKMQLTGWNVVAPSSHAPVLRLLLNGCDAAKDLHKAVCDCG